MAGARKVWGTRKKESCNEIAREVVKVGGEGGIWLLCTEAGRSVEWERWVVVCSESP